MRIERVGVPHFPMWTQCSEVQGLAKQKPYCKTCLFCGQSRAEEGQTGTKAMSSTGAIQNSQIQAQNPAFRRLNYSFEWI